MRRGGMTMDEKQVARINELARKSRMSGLTPEEKEEQAKLRAQYLREFRETMEQTLRSVRVQQEDGSVKPLRKKH